jgi:hypothetical protein
MWLLPMLHTPTESWLSGAGTLCGSDFAPVFVVRRSPNHL